MPKYSSPLIAPAFLGAWAGGFGEAWFVSNTTNPTEAQGQGIPARQGTTPQNPFTTVAAAITAATAGRGDVVFIQGGTYSENLTSFKSGMTFIGVPTGYKDRVVIQGNAVLSGVSNVTFKNIEFFGNSTNNASVRIGAYSDSANSNSSIWFEKCSFASDGTTEPAYGCILFGGTNIGFIECSFIDNTRALAIRGSQGELPYHVVVKRCEFLENTTADITSGSGGVTGFTDTAGSGVDAGVNALVVVDNVFGRGETTPTFYIRLISAGASSGVVAKNHIANATNAVTAIRVPAGVFYCANSTEAGNTTARPA